MAELAQPSREERQQLRELARDIVDAIADDEEMPGIDWLEIEENDHHPAAIVAERSNVEALSGALAQEVLALEERQEALLVAIQRITREQPYPEETRGREALIAEVGTLRARIRELEHELAGARRATLSMSPAHRPKEWDDIAAAINSYIPKGSAYHAERFALQRWLNAAGTALTVALQRDVYPRLMFCRVSEKTTPNEVEGPTGKLVVVEVPPNVTIHASDANRISRILDIAETIGREWREQEGVAAGRLDELGEATLGIEASPPACAGCGHIQDAHSTIAPHRCTQVVVDDWREGDDGGLCQCASYQPKSDPHDRT